MELRIIILLTLGVYIQATAQHNYDNQSIIYSNNNKVGIGIVNPDYRLHVYNPSETDNNDLALFSGHTVTGLHKDRFNRIIIRNRNGQQSWFGIEGSGNSAIGYIGIEHWLDNPSIALSWSKGGNVGIGTTSPDSKLTVAGKIHAQEIKVTTTAGADFVFEEGYNLRSLEETERFIKENKRLPDIPSEKEMVVEGLTLGEMNIKLLQKIEELTLYAIEQNKKIEQLQNEIIHLNKKINEK